MKYKLRVGTVKYKLGPGTKETQIPLRLRDRHVFMWQSLAILNVFNTLTLKKVFWKTKTFLKTLEYHFLVHSITNESATLPYKTALPKANVKTN